ncbi:hypothetical protein MMC29_006978 [Sticta canariensis]|nr:hypothetical protein [Sticta canariensis]
MRAFHLLHALWVVVAIARPVEREAFERYSVKARDVKSFPIGIALQTNQFPYSAPRHVAVQKRSEGASTPTPVENPKIERRNISRRGSNDYLGILTYELPKALVIDSIQKWLGHFVKSPSPKGSEPAPAPSAPPTGQQACLSSENFQYTPEVGSGLSNLLSGKRAIRRRSPYDYLDILTYELPKALAIDSIQKWVGHFVKSPSPKGEETASEPSAPPPDQQACSPSASLPYTPEVGSGLSNLLSGR